MSTFSPSSSSTFGVNINSTLADGYTSSATPLEITITFNGQVPDSSLENETNFLIQSGIPGNIVPGALDISFSKSALDQNKYIGFRLSSATANTNFDFQTTDSTNFSTSSLTIASSTSTDPGTIIWSKTLASALSGTDSLNIPVQINYLGTTPGTSVTFNVDLFEATDTSAANPTKIVTITGTNGTPVQTLSTTAFSANLTSTMTASDPGSFATSKNSYLRNSAIALNTNLATTITAGSYKPMSKLVLTETISTNITATTLYATLLTNPASQSVLDADTTSTVKVNLSTLTNSDVTYNTTTGVIQITMLPTNSFSSLFTGTGSTIPATLNLYVIGTVSGLA